MINLIIKEFRKSSLNSIKALKLQDSFSNVEEVKPKRRYSRLTYHHHPVRQIIMGLKDYLEDFSFYYTQLDSYDKKVSRPDCCQHHRIGEYQWILNPPFGTGV